MKFYSNWGKITPEKHENPETHDYTNPRWGHDYVVQDIDKKTNDVKLAGWGHGIAPGDYLLLLDGNRQSTRYQVKSIEYFRDPGDMWTCVAAFKPRFHG